MDEKRQAPPPAEPPLISVIIPVYRTEPFLRQCLDSVVGQTYERLEIILVDDGSPDGCPAICDAYAARDRRIKVLHRKNAGVSAARNAGLAAAGGSWIGWVDSDDWIEPETFALMAEGALTYGADVVVCGRVEEFRGHRLPRSWGKRELLGRTDALAALLENGSIQNFLWDKLWKRELFRGLSFPEGRNYEDIALTGQLFERAEAVLFLPELCYHYRQRPGSIVDDLTLGNRLDHYEAAKARCDALRGRCPQFRHLLEAQCAASAIGIWSCYYKNPRPMRKAYLPQLREIAGSAGPHCREAAAALSEGLAGRWILRLIPHARWWSFACARVIGWAYRLRHGREL